ncbi:hypothetical protein DVH05_025604 [Phytophthora capsici]|nr:hypothetical protein DVH05_025604 [Phytophthora capsici]
MQLPCRHVIVYKKFTGSAFAIPFAAILVKWFRQTRLQIGELPQLQSPFVAKASKKVKTQHDRALTTQEKYRLLV